MNGEIRDPDPVDDDIPVLTDIVVPGRLQAASPDPAEAEQVAPEFVFDIDFNPKAERGLTRDDFRAAEPVFAPEPEGVADAPEGAFPKGPPGQDAELPLPWADLAPEPGRDASEPLIVAAFAKSAAARVEPPDPDAQTLLRALLEEIGSGLERRVEQELALTEQRLRTALREELDRKLSELLASTPPTA